MPLLWGKIRKTNFKSLFYNKIGGFNMGNDLRPGKEKDSRIRQAEALERIAAALERLTAPKPKKPKE
jgi:hypothetical protein